MTKTANTGMRISRRTMGLILLSGIVLAGSGHIDMVRAAEAKAATRAHPAVRYMQKVARDLLRAYRVGTIASFDKVLARHADVPAIALYSLGRYQNKLPRSRRSLYYRGVRQFMARYFAEQSHKYEIAKAWIENNPLKDGDDWLVRSRVKLTSGATYTVVWRVVKRRGRYRIADVKVLGFSLAYLQRGIFHRYLQKKNGDVNALVAALNR